jgi:predicted O-linked N-acetylglucosamine transferase (SPINDLY family)
MSELDRAIEAIQQGTPERGCELLSHWLDRNPGRAELHLMLALTQASLGRIQDAITSLKSAIAAKPGLASAHYNLGTLLQQSGQSKAALLELRVAVAQDPTHERAWINLSATAFYSMELTLAELAARRALELDPKSLEAWVNLGNALKGQARIAQALSAYEQASLIDPNYEVAASNALLARCYIEQDAALLCAAHQRNGARIAATITARACPARKPQKQMRIGYVSGDFRFHAVAYFFGSLLKCHDRSQFDVCL